MRPRLALAERDLAVHLEDALRGLIIADRWPKSGIEVNLTVLEIETQPVRNSDIKGLSGLSQQLLLSECITAASAAIIDAGIDCFDLVTGGVAALVQRPEKSSTVTPSVSEIVSDPSLSECENLLATCLVGYSQSRDELTEFWFQDITGQTTPADMFDGHYINEMMDQAVEAAQGARLVLVESLQDALKVKMDRANNSRITAAP